jgi:serine/threonine protein kinase
MPEIGQTLSHFKIVEKIGQGGMGEVYLAEDTTLDRKVALKFLPEAFTSDPERMARFEREAKLLASLNHPNIAGIYGLEHADGNRFLVLEYVEGETLQARLSKGALPLEDALSLCRQIAEGLEAAHEKGVIHRDLKPANVMITAEEKVKILDFGLAKALSDETQSIDSSQSPTLTEAMTRPGMILGTAAYMSPEQAKGKSVDKRADIWAFGCILYECLTGKKAFEGETVTETLAAVLRGDPDWNDLSERTPQNIQVILRRCLEKDRKRRLRDIGDLILEAEPVAFISSAHQSIWKHPLVWVLVLVAAALLVYALLKRPTSVPVTVARLSIPLPPGEQITEPPAISPDGQIIAYVSQKGMDEPQLYLRNLNSFESKLVTGSSSAKQPFFSPDGKWIAFFAQGQLFKSEVKGGIPISICNAPIPLGGTWNEDDTIIYTTGLHGGLFRISASDKGGNPEPLTKLDDPSLGYAHAWPQSLPGGQSILFDIWGINGEIFKVAILSLDSNEWKPVEAGEPGGAFCLSPGGDGFLLYSNLASSIRAVRFDPENPMIKNADTSILNDVFFSGNKGKIYLAVSKNGTTVYAKGNPTKKSLTWLSRDGKTEGLVKEQNMYNSIVLSPEPDGSRLLVEQAYEIWMYDIERPETGTRITLPGRSGNSTPIWNADGSKIYFSSTQGGDWDIYVKSADDSLRPKILLKRPNDQFPSWVTRDGTLLFLEQHPVTGNDIWALSPDGKVSDVRVTQFNEWFCTISPNEHWIAYVSDETDRSEVYIQDYPGRKTDPRRVSTNGGTEPKWSHDGKELFYRDFGAMMAVTIGPDGSPSDPYKLFDSVMDYESTYNSYDISPDDKKFLIIRQDPGSIPNQLNVILNWTEELQRLVPKEGQ